MEDQFVTADFCHSLILTGLAQCKSFCQAAVLEGKSARAWAVLKAAVPFRAYPPAPAWGPPWAAVLMSVFVLFHLLQEDLCPGTWSTTAFSFSDLAFHVAVSHLLSKSLQPVWCFCPFLNLFAQRCPQLCCGAQLCPVVGLFPALTGVG